MAKKISLIIEELGFEFLTNSKSNQIFPILPNSIIRKLQENYAFYIWSVIDEERSSVRLVTSWATKEEDVEKFINDIKKYANNSSK